LTTQVAHAVASLLLSCEVVANEEGLSLTSRQKLVGPPFRLAADLFKSFPINIQGRAVTGAGAILHEYVRCRDVARPD